MLASRLDESWDPSVQVLDGLLAVWSEVQATVAVRADADSVLGDVGTTPREPPNVMDLQEWHTDVGVEGALLSAALADALGLLEHPRLHGGISLV